jgi:hypothetical protein
VHVEVLGHGLVDQVQEPTELLGSVPGGEVRDHVARRDIEGGVEVGGAVALVVVGATLGVPGINGSTGAVRSRAWTWVFSSTHNTTAASGGFKYRPTTSRTLSMN